MKFLIYLVAFLILTPFLSFCGPNGASQVANNPLNGDTTGAGSLARQKQIFEADAAEKERIKYENQRTYEEQLASLNLLRDNLAALQSPNAGGLFRSVHDVTNYIYDFSGGWHGISGRVIQTLPDGVLVKPELDTDVFVEGYPFQTVDDQIFGGCQGKDDGVYSFTAVSGGRRTVKKMSYGITVTPSPEQLEQEVNLAKYRIENHPIVVKAKADAEARQRLLEKVKTAREHALKLNQEQAEKGDPTALRRMGERYRDGDGVDKNESEAAKYFKKADDATEKERQKMAVESQLREESQKKQKFLWAVDQAEKGAVSGMILAGKCYRDGNGTEKDLSKARQYFRKAADLGSTDAADLIDTCK